MDDKIYDLIIIGAGPAGLSSCIYAGRANIDTLLIEKQQEGGQIIKTNIIENYPGCIDGESGQSLIDRMSKQVEKINIKKVYDEVKNIKCDNKIKIVNCEKTIYKAKSIIIATGCHSKPIGCKNEEKYVGLGISYCATCDANFFVDCDVYVVGGGNSALEEAIYLTSFAKSVTIIHRREEFRADKIIQEKVKNNKKIKIIYNSIVEEVGGDNILKYIIIKNVIDGQISKIETNENEIIGLFGFIGIVPNTNNFKNVLLMDEDGFIITDQDMQTNICGVYACGDVREKSLRQVVTAVSDGAIAATQARLYIENYDN